MLAIVAPGQGAQTPGMLSAWCEDSALRDYVQTASDQCGLDLFRLGTAAEADEIKDTANAQPLIVIAGLLGFRALGVSPTVVAGHSVGEITAAAVGGVISDQDALTLVRTRGVEMAQVAASIPSGMSAVLGGERADVLAALENLGLIAANDNGAGQIVAAGDLQSLAALAENPPAGARVRALAVAGAFHTPVMKPAVTAVGKLAATLPVHSPQALILSNKDGAAISDGREVIDRIVEQIAHPVRWNLCMSSLKTLGVTGVIELPPAGTLVGLLKRAEPTIETFALKSPNEIAAAREFAAAHS